MLPCGRACAPGARTPGPGGAPGGNVTGRVGSEQAERRDHVISCSAARPRPFGENRPVPPRPLSAIVLAAGEGTRMRSAIPKPLHRLCGRPMVLHVLDALAELPIERVVVVVGYRSVDVVKAVQAEAPPELRVEFVEQSQPLGTGDAAAVALTGFDEGADLKDGDLVILPGDTPLLRPATLAELVRAHRRSDAAATLLTARIADATGYGRVVRSKSGNVARIVERRGRERGRTGDRGGRDLDLLLPSRRARADAAPPVACQRAGRVLPDRHDRRSRRRGLPGRDGGRARSRRDGGSERPGPARRR